jgi:hypothetical protein
MCVILFFSFLLDKWGYRYDEPLGFFLHRFAISARDSVYVKNVGMESGELYA